MLNLSATGGGFMINAAAHRHGALEIFWLYLVKGSMTTI